MFKFKKIIAAVCSLALLGSMSLFSVAEAAGYNPVTVGLSDGTKNYESTALATANYFNIDLSGMLAEITDDGINGNIFSGVNIKLKLPKDAFKSVGIQSSPDELMDLNGNKVVPRATFNSDQADADYALITINAADPCLTTDEKVAQVKLTYKTKKDTNPYVIEFVKDECYMTIVDAEGNNIAAGVALLGTDKKYELAGGSNKVTEVSDKPTEKHVEVAVKNAKGEAVNLETPNYNYSDTNGDVAVAFMATVTPNDDTVNGIKWTVKSGDVEKPFAKVFDGTITGATAVSYGLIIKGIDTVQSVNAAATVVE